MSREHDENLKAILRRMAANNSLRQLFSDVDDDFWYWLFTHGYDSNPLVRQILPSTPNEEIQKKFTGRSGHLALSQAFAAYKLFKAILTEHYKDIRHCERVMDFGCGWGRIIRFFLRDIDGQGLWGIDCYGEMIELCRSQGLPCQFMAIDPIPPTSFPSESFDLVYLYSVFSHLSEETHLKWLEEFRRILKPGGIVIATTRPRKHILICYEQSKQTDIEDWQRGGALSFLEPEKAQADYDAGKFVHSPVGGGGVLSASFYGESCIPKKYVEENWTTLFPFVGYIHIEEHRSFDQEVIYARK